MSNSIEEKYKDYKFWFNWTSSEPFDPVSDSVEVRLRRQDGEEYLCEYTTPKFIAYMFEKNMRTGECAGGTYFCIPKMVIVQELSIDNVQASIDDLIENKEVEHYFTKVD